MGAMRLVAVLMHQRVRLWSGCDLAAVVAPALPARALSRVRAVSLVMRPSSISIWRGSCAASSRSWVITTIVAPAACSSCRSAKIAAPVAESRFPVGSSASTIAGWPTRARAIATRWRSPPESCVGRARSRWPSPTATRTSAACSRSGGKSNCVCGGCDETGKTPLQRRLDQLP